MEDLELIELQKAEIALDEAKRDKCLACVSSLYEFLLSFWDIVSTDALIDNWHIKYLCDELEKLGRRLIAREVGIPDYIINIPPGMTKSIIVTEVFPVWLWLHAPNFSIISSSYSKGLSTDHSLKSKNIVKSDKFQELFQPYFKQRFGKYLLLTKDHENDWRNNFGGMRYATSTNGTAMGKHAHLVLRDDPINPEQAESKAYRDRCNRFNDRTLSSRKVDKDRTPTLTVMQRLHEDDTTGHDLKKVGKKIFHICLPGELTNDVKPPELRAKYINGLLDPIRLSRDTLAGMKTDLGGYGYAGQILQTPIKAGGNMIKTDWILRFSLLGLIERTGGVGSLIWNFTIDGAYTDKEENDSTAILAYAIYNNSLYIRDVANVRMEMPELIKFIPDFVMRNGYSKVSRIFVEPKASGLPIIQMIKNQTRLNIIADEPPKSSKVQRVAESLPFIEAGKVYILDGAAFVQAFLDELKIFPLADHDDQVDALTMAIRRTFKKPGIKISQLSGSIP